MIEVIPWWLKLLAATGLTLLLALIAVTIVTIWKILTRQWKQ